MCDSRTFVLVEGIVEVVGYLIIIVDQLHSYMTSVSPTGNGAFQQDSVPCQKARIMLEWFEKHKDEFQLISWPSNSVYLNQIGHIWVFVERKLRDQTSSCPNILTLHNHCLDNWYNLSPVIDQELVISMAR
ncbi:transposable element Tc1 transposase [Trichonephila clavipes]|uniref:Transposable element Tc1 transposase n=1 Tax=Trichonephila clavipes TaxID=2585209 RepID=A0A8X6SIJ6_TRICX|nr:transposable element Tc1 transposase [Trichonephila clavipes]